jgi:molecular chaperone GrpE (heat shock protein)
LEGPHDGIRHLRGGGGPAQVGSSNRAGAEYALHGTKDARGHVFLADAVQKIARAQARMSLKLDDVEGKLEAGLQELRQQQKQGNDDDDDGLDPVLDAVDLLEEAARTARRGGDETLATGIAGIGARLSTFLGDAGVSRVGAAGVPPDPRLFRVVGTEPGHPAGVVTRVVRAAVLSGDKVLREGEVLIAARGDT